MHGVVDHIHRIAVGHPRTSPVESDTRRPLWPGRPRVAFRTDWTRGTRRTRCARIASRPLWSGGALRTLNTLRTRLPGGALRPGRPGKAGSALRSARSLRSDCALRPDRHVDLGIAVVIVAVVIASARRRADDDHVYQPGAMLTGRSAVMV